MKPAYIFDIDGTLSDCSHRLRYILPPEGISPFEGDKIDWQPDWDKFYEESVNDKPILNVINTLRRLYKSGAKILFVTGRNEACRDLTIQWIDNFVGINDYELFMRSNLDRRQDAVVKKDIYLQCIKNSYVVIGVFEDRKQCVDMWRLQDLTCYQVADGNY